MRRLTIFVLLSSTALTAAQQAKKFTYDDDILPVFRERCLNCHNPDKKRGDLDLSSHVGLTAGGASGEVIAPGDPSGSRLFLVIDHAEDPKMPPKSPKLPQKELDLVRNWIAGGALASSGSKVKAVKKLPTEVAAVKPSIGRPAGPPPMPGKLSLKPVIHTPRPTALNALAASPWAPLVAVGGQKQVVLYHADTLALLGVLPFPEGNPYVLKFSRNGNLLLAGGGVDGKSGRFVAWDIRTGKRVIELGEEYDAVLAADLTADQATLALGGPGKVVKLFEVATGDQIGLIKKHTDWIYCLEFSPDGKLLASGDRNGGLFLTEARTGQELFALRGHTAAVTDVVWRDDSTVVASTSEDGTVRMWDARTGRQLRQWAAHGGGVLSVHMAHDGRLVTAGRDKSVKVWTKDGGLAKSLDPFRDVALRAVLTHDGTRVIAGDWLGEIRVWTTGNGKRIGQLTANP